MKILVVNYNGGSPHHGPNLRTFYAAESLVSSGNIVRCVSASYSHKYSRLPSVKAPLTSEVISGVQYTWVKVNKYSGIASRIFSQYQYAFKLLWYQRDLKDEYDVIIFSAPPPDVFFAVMVLSKIYGCPIISDVRDLWPLTQLQMSWVHYLNPYAMWLWLSERLMLKVSKRIVSPLPGIKKYFKNRKFQSKVSIIQNGVVLKQNQLNSELSLKLLCDGYVYGFKEGQEILVSELAERGELIVGYSGSLDRDNDVQALLDCARQLRDEKGVVFVIVGGGVLFDKVRAQAEPLPNVLLFDRVLSVDVPTVLSSFDVCFCALKPKRIYKYGVSLAKMYEYMAAARPIIWMIDAANNPVEDSGCGISVRPGDVSALCRTVIEFRNMPYASRREMGDKGFQHLAERFSYRVLGANWQRLCEETVSN